MFHTFLLAKSVFIGFEAILFFAIVVHTSNGTPACNKLLQFVILNIIKILF
jgi:hypothetical protein